MLGLSSAEGGAVEGSESAIVVGARVGFAGVASMSVGVSACIGTGLGGFPVMKDVEAGVKRWRYRFASRFVEEDFRTER